MGVELDEVWPFEQPGGMGRRRAVGPYHHGSYRPEVSARNVECIPGSSGCTRGGVIVALLILESVRRRGLPLSTLRGGFLHNRLGHWGGFNAFIDFSCAERKK